VSSTFIRLLLLLSLGSYASFLIIICKGFGPFSREYRPEVFFTESRTILARIRKILNKKIKKPIGQKMLLENETSRRISNEHGARSSFE
jgi:hypothetical protein